MAVFDELVAEVSDALAQLQDWGNSGQRSDQYTHDVVADEVLTPGLHAAGFTVLSEESGLTRPGAQSGAPGSGGSVGGLPSDGEIVVVVDPVDGSTNASRGLPWYATSLCAVDADGPLVSSVVNLASGERFQAVRGHGAEADRIIAPTQCDQLAEAIVAMSGWAPSHGGWSQYRCYGASALDICGVATGMFDAFVDIDGAHGAWDYLGALLVCEEAGVPMVDAEGRDLVVLDHDARRAPLAAATPKLLEELRQQWQAWRR